ncbi:MAG: hypothetical protein F4029_10455 [Gammaproteobacteria bacterium]|nr:hypothetical protein [Gammaproteobacteria bacterium]MYK46635.1 hypothetical protein [Gammaproteobacteria bacterium]
MFPCEPMLHSIPESRLPEGRMRYTPFMSCGVATVRSPHAIGALFLVCLLATGCATTPAETPPAYDDLVGLTVDEQAIDVNLVTRIRTAFLATPDVDERIRAVTLLEQEVDGLLQVGQPLRLGPIGSAILEHYQASITGHLALAAFYRHVDMPEQTARHEAWIAAISAALEANGDGTFEAPYPALSPNEAKGYLRAQGLTPVGSSYRQSQDHPFMLWITATRENRPLENAFFDLDALYSAIAASVARKPTTVFPIGPPRTCSELGICDKFSPMAFIQLLAAGNDDAALTFLGWKGLSRFNDAVHALRLAATAGNAVASRILAELWVQAAYNGSQEAKQRDEYLLGAEQNFRVAVRAGFDDAMFELGRLYLIGAYGSEKTADGMPLILRSAGLGNPEALLWLGWRHVLGDFVDRDHERAEQYFLRAAERDEMGKLEYARFLMRRDVDRGFNERAYRWVRQFARNDNAHAMVLIGDLYARGLHVGRSFRRAGSWFKNAVRAAPDDPYLVNEVAWRLAVTHLPKLRNERYALEIMERIMAESAEARRNPAYLDTWAAAYAANGNFERAIAVQEQAVQEARASSNNDLPILLEHLEAFRAGEKISEQVP